MITSKIKSILKDSDPTDSVENEGEAEDRSSKEDRSPKNLLHKCTECSTVYLSEGSHTCSNCDSMTRQIETSD